MGMNLFTIQSRSPAATSVISTVERGISNSPLVSRIRRHYGIVEKLLGVEAFRKRRMIAPLHSHSSKSMEKYLSHNAHPAAERDKG
jgi:hypothetical protein